MATSAELTCRELVELVTDYLENTLPPSEVRRFEEHLKGCTGCRTYLEQFRQVINALGRLTEEAVPEGARQELLKVFRDWKREQQKGG
jgi:anti-sigma factor RsiW